MVSKPLHIPTCFHHLTSRPFWYWNTLCIGKCPSLWVVCLNILASKYWYYSIKNCAMKGNGEIKKASETLTDFTALVKFVIEY